MSLIQKKYKRLLGELSYVDSELKYVEDILKEAHTEFEVYYRNYCERHNVPLSELNEKHAEKLERVFPKKQEVDEEGLVKTAKSDKNEQKVDKSLQKMYRKAATMTHPDKFPDEKSPEAIEASERFKRLTSAFNEKKWSEFLDICQKLDILPSTYKKILEIIRGEIAEIKSKTETLKLSFSWRLFECEDEEACKERVIENFLFQLFKYEKDTIII